jgi:hypothetical protein
VSGPGRDLGPRPASCLFEGILVHRRLRPERRFRHRVAMAYIDLDELPELLGGRLLRGSPGALRFRRADYHGDPGIELATAVRDSVERELGTRPPGPVRLLTNLRSFGLCFNPVSFYYCFDAGGEQLQAVLAGGSGRLQKLLHVSPFMPMDQAYTFQAAAPTERLAVTIENHRAQQREFVAALVLDRVELTRAAVRRISFRYPLTTVRTLVLIYGHALGLRLAGVRPFQHPQRGAA